MLNEQEIRLLNLFRAADELDRLTIVSLLESRRPVGRVSRAALHLVGEQKGRMLEPGASCITNEVATGLVARAV